MKFTRLDEPIRFDELWQAAGVTKGLAQNWTNGRPLRVVPSLFQGDGKGSHHVYAKADAYLIAFLHLLKHSGLSDESLRKIVDVFNLRPVGEPSPAIQYFSAQHHWFQVSLTELTVSIGPIPYDPSVGTQPVAQPLQLNDVHDLIGIQAAVNLDKLRAQVDQRLDNYRKKSKRKRR